MSDETIKRTVVRPVLLTAAVGAVAVVVGSIAAGVAGFWGALLATIVVVTFFGFGQWAIQKVLANNPALGLNVALGVYLGQVLVLFLILALLREATFFNPKVFAATVVVCALVWTVQIVVALSKRPQAYVEPESTLGLSDDPEVIARLRDSQK